MRAFRFGILAAVVGTACGDAAAPVTPHHAPNDKVGLEVPNPDKTERLSADTPKTTREGNTFIAPAGWTLTTRGAASILEAPEGDSHIALVDVRAKDADAAVAAAWAAYKPDAKWPLQVKTDGADKDGWGDIAVYNYQTSPNEKRQVEVDVQRANDVWTVAIYDVTTAVGSKRGGAIQLIFRRLLPKDYVRESFAGKKANTLDGARIAKLTEWTENAMKQFAIPGVAVGIVQDGKLVFAGGFGVRELGKKEKPDAETLFMIASNTKALTTLMLAKLVDEKKMTWDTPVTKLLPTFKLGDEATTQQVLVKHLVCACTGIPRQDLEWLFEFKKLSPDGAMATLATMQPSTKFGEAFQYSNPLAAAAGYVGGHVMSPKQALGPAYDEAMRAQVLEPLGMRSTTFDYAKALAGNHASPHGQDLDAKTWKVPLDIDYSIIPIRPAGAAWSSVKDLLAYVSMELAEGALPGGKRYIGKEALLERRKPQVSMSKDETYGMGLMVDSKYEVPVVHHGGDMIGFHSDMIWLPEQNIGAVILTNSDAGWLLRDIFRRKLLEVIFDGKPEADADVAAAAKRYFTEIAGMRRLLIIPADPAVTTQLAKRYSNAALGEIAVSRSGATTTFDVGEWKSDVGSRKNPDDTLSVTMTSAGMPGFEFVLGTHDGKRTLTLRDDQHEYVFTEQ